jgi:hypothetical protein
MSSFAAVSTGHSKLEEQVVVVNGRLAFGGFGGFAAICGETT